jgi:ABC-type glycerol-3-phosphate transport system substrate-binding protein
MLSRVPEAKREAAWAFMKHMLSPASIAFFAEQSGYVAFSEGARAEAADWLAGEDIAALHEALPHVRGDFSINMAPPVREAFDAAFLAIVMKDAPVAETLAEADARAEQAMAAGAEK